MAYSRSYPKRNTRVSFHNIPTPTCPTFVPSPYQQAIIDWLTTGHGNAIISATAGSGKTSTLVRLAFDIPTTKSAVFLAFNKSIATELSEKLPSHVTSSTFHALGFRAVAPTLAALANVPRVQVDANKVGNIFDTHFPNENSPLHGKARTPALRLASLFKNTGAHPTTYTLDWQQTTIAHFDLDTADVDDTTLASMVSHILNESFKDSATIDFDDMLWLPILHNVRFSTFDYVMVDEAQDTNEVQRIILRRLLSPTSRLIAVGDHAQAIYGFRGASHDALSQIATDFDAITLPLSISYRCPRQVVAIAQQYATNIEASPNAKEGTILYPQKWSLADFLPTDLIVCRNTAPLISLAYRALRARYPIRIMGREIGKGLISLIKRLAGKSITNLDALADRVSRYQQEETERALAKKQDGKVQAIADRCESIIMLIDGMTDDDRTAGIPGLIRIIEALFDDSARGITTAATIHKAKGMEAPRVIFLDSHLCPSKYARQPWELQQETNLQFVAVTRSLDTLVYLDSDTLKRSDD